jgi:hypothetical protein
LKASLGLVSCANSTPLAGSLNNRQLTKQAFNNASFLDSFAEVVEEEKQEDDGLNINLRRRQARFILPKDQNEFNKKSKRNRSTDFLKQKGIDKFTSSF